MSFTDKDRDGWVYFSLGGDDRYGNKGIRIVQGSSFYLDTQPPKAYVYLKRKRVGLGKNPVTVDFGENVKDGPILFYRIGEKETQIALKRASGNRFTGEVVLSEGTPSGKAVFGVKAVDSQGHRGGEVVRGKDFVIDTQRPDSPLALLVKPAPDRSLAVSWTAPPREPVTFYRVYGGAAPTVKPGADTLLADNVRDIKAVCKPKAEGVVWITVCAVDEAGNESLPAKVTKIADWSFTSAKTDSHSALSL